MNVLHPPTRRRRARIAALAVLLGAALAAACNSDSPTDPTVPRALAVVSGDSQRITVGTAAAAPLVVRVTGSGDAPLAGIPVTWTIPTGGGSLSATTDTTDADGRSEVIYTAGTTAGTATVTATTGFIASTFTLTLTAGAATRLSKFGADNPAAVAGSAFPLSAKVSDQYGNGIPGVTVSWTSTGGATLSTATGTSDSGGIVTTTVTLGQSAGTYTVTATAEGFAPVTYTITAI